MSNEPDPKQTARYSIFDMMQWMDAEVREAFKAAGKRRRYRAGQRIYANGEPGYEMFRLISGNVRVSVTREDGREMIFLLFESGDCFGESSLVDGGPRPQTADALTDIEVDVLDLHAFNQLRLRYRAFDDALLKLLAKQMRIVSTIYVDTNLSDLPARVASRILAAASSLGAASSDGSALSVPMAQSEVALMVGASRQSVNKVLQRLQNEGALTIEYGRIVIRDRACLQRIAAGQ